MGVGTLEGPLPKAPYTLASVLQLPTFRRFAKPALPIVRGFLCSQGSKLFQATHDPGSLLQSPLLSCRALLE